jgi:hypothetical protein
MRISGICICLFMVAIWLGCSGDKRDIRAYYFPVENLRKGQVYEYTVAQNGIEASEYWYYRTFVRDSGLFLAATYYDQNFQIGQIMREKIEPAAAVARSYFFYEIDSTRLEDENGGQVQSEANIQSAQVFPFEVSDSAQAYAFALQYRPATDPRFAVTVRRERFFLGDGPAFTFRGRSFKCVRFGLREFIGSQNTKSIDIEAQGEEWYAKGLGLVWYRKTYGAGAFSLEGRLTDIFPMAELEKRAAAVYGD